MNTVLKRPAGRTPLAGLGKLTVAALVGVALGLGGLQMIMGNDAPVALFGLPALLVGGLMLFGWRWTPALGSLVSAALLVLLGIPLKETLTHPSTGGSLFMVATPIIVLLLIGLGAGIAATFQNYRYATHERPMPRGVTNLLLVVAGAVVGMIGVVALPQPGIAAGISPSELVKLPVLSAKNYMFDQKELQARVGQTVTLRLQNADAEAHYLDIDELNIHAPIAPGKTSLAVFTPTKPGTYLFYCHPHADKTSGQGMVGKLIVAP